MDEFDGVEVEVEKDGVQEKIVCPLCGKESPLFTEQDWVKFWRFKCCFLCYIHKVQ